MNFFSDLAAQFPKSKLFRFFLVSGLNTIFGYGLFVSLLYLGVYYQLALLISTIAGILFNFKTIGIIVFRSHNNILIFKFLCVYTITYLCNLGGLAFLKSFELNLYWGGAILLIPTGLLAFLLNNLFVFTRHK
jgi:putative flippase GtrA